MTPGELRDARVALGLTQAELAFRLDVTIQTISNWETGRHPIRTSAAQLVRSWAANGKVPA